MNTRIGIAVEQKENSTQDLGFPYERVSAAFTQTEVISLPSEEKGKTPKVKGRGKEVGRGCETDGRVPIIDQ